MSTTSGSEPRRFTWGGAKDSAPRWSPHGTRLAFLSNRGAERPQLHIMPSTGGVGRRITFLPEGVGASLWSPDGKRIALVARVPTSTADAGKKAENAPARVITTLKYRANGEGFIYDRRKHIFIVDAETGECRQLTDGDWDDVQAAWSPDARQIAFILLVTRPATTIEPPQSSWWMQTAENRDRSPQTARTSRFLPVAGRAPNSLPWASRRRGCAPQQPALAGSGVRRRSSLPHRPNRPHAGDSHRQRRRFGAPMVRQFTQAFSTGVEWG